MPNPYKLQRPENAKPPFQILNIDNSNEPARINIYDIIGETWWDDGVTGKSFVNELAPLGKTRDLNVHISSFGGDVVDGTVIYNSLLQHQGTVNIIIEGWACSIASIIAMAGDTVKISAIGMIMIHKPLNWCGGNANDMRKNANMLDKVEGALSIAYTQKTGIAAAEIATMLDAETWMTAEEAIELGFADEIIEAPGSAITNHFSKDTISNCKNIPQNVLNALEQESETADEVDEESTDDNEDIVDTENTDVDDNSTDESTDENSEESTDEENTESTEDLPEESVEVPAKKETKVVDQVQAETDRSMGIISACNIAGRPHLAEGYIKNKYSLDVVKNLLSEIKAGLEEQPSENNLTNQHSNQHSNQPKNTSSADIWASGHDIAGIKTK